MRKILIIDVPVIHAGYLQLFADYANSVSAVLVLGEGIIEQFRDPVREIRRLDPRTAVRIIDRSGFFPSTTPVSVLDSGDDRSLQTGTFVTLDDVICQRFVARCLRGRIVQFDTTFLRWDSGNVTTSSAVAYDRVVKLTDIDGIEAIAERAIAEGNKSTSWWRQVGIVAFRGREILGVAHNTHLPDEQSVFMEGDPRDFIEAGTNSGLSTAIHAEAKLVAQLGRPILDGANVFLTTFPCVPCAQLLVEAGIKRLYYLEGNAYLHVDQTLKDMGMEIIYVQTS